MLLCAFLSDRKGMEEEVNQGQAALKAPSPTADRTIWSMNLGSAYF